MPARTSDLVKQVLMGRCPQCGTGPLFDGYLKLAPKCSTCGAVFPDDASADGPAVFVILLVGFIIVGGMMITQITMSPPLWLQMLIWGPLALGLCLALLRPLKALFITLHYLHGVEEETPQGGSGKDRL